MGIYDREYYQDDHPRFGFGGGGQMTMVVRIALANGIIYLIGLFFNDNWLMYQMALESETAAQPWMWWKFLTYGFAHSPTDPTHLIFNMLALWFLGQSVERKYGAAEFLRFYLITLVLCGVVWGVVNYLGGTNARLVGASGAVTAVVILFAVNFPKQQIMFMFILPMPAWVLGVLVVAMDLFQAQGVIAVDGGKSQIAFDVHLTGAAFAAAYYYLNLNFGKWMGGNFRIKLPSLKRRPKLKVHDPDQSYEQLDEEADRVLDKLHQEGEDSLTPREKKTLEDYSRRMRQKHR